ncbi:hydrogenase expression/formation protein HypE [candidate division WOR-3 bacterium]|nr:hydrogenase expression/formation protein HypE [candidate division WOR-3 bacterium]
MDNGNIFLAHGAGGKLQAELIHNFILKYFGNPVLNLLEDSAVIEKSIAFTTDSYVVKPIFFPGGDIGKLAVSGTVNDLLCSGATPRYLSLSLIIEEGFSFKKLDTILRSAKCEAGGAGVDIVCGDIKVVGKGELDEIFINTSGVGIINGEALSIKKIAPGDRVIVTGSIGDHGISILLKREGLKFGTSLISDCASLTGLAESILKPAYEVHYFRDPTRGGLGGVLAEIANSTGLGIEIEEEKLPIKEDVRGASELLGIDPLYSANEGRFVVFVPEDHSQEVLNVIREDKFGREAEIIGEVGETNPSTCVLLTKIGGKRIIDLPRGELLPRIC